MEAYEYISNSRINRLSEEPFDDQSQSFYASEISEIWKNNLAESTKEKTKKVALEKSMQLGDRLMLNEGYMNMANNIISSQPGMMSNSARWSEGRSGANEQTIAYENAKSNPVSKMKEHHRPIGMNMQLSNSPNSVAGDSVTAEREQRDMSIRRDKGVDKNLRCEEMMPTLDYFMHGGYPYPNLNFQSRRDSPPDIMAAERCKQAFTRGSHGFRPENARNMHPDLSKITAEQIEAIYKSQGMGISVTVSPPEFPDRTGIIPAGSRTGIPSQRPSPKTDMQHHSDFGKTISFMGMEDKLLRIADSEKSGRNDLNAANPGMFPGVIRMPATSQMQGFQGLNIHQQNNTRFNPEMMHQAAFGMDPRFFEQSRMFPMNSSRHEHASPGEMSSQRFPGRANDNGGQKKTLHVPSRPMALGPNFVPQTHLPLNVTHGTPCSEEMGSGSPAEGSPYADIGTPSPKSEDHPRLGTKQKAKHRPEVNNHCNLCGKGFSSSSALAKHKLIHSDERRYVCTICSKGFKRQDHLNGHMITHRDKKPYECHFSDCEKSYSDMRSLKRHLENHHGITAMSSSPTAPQSSVSHSSLSMTSSKHLLSPTTEDRNNNMKGAIAPERPSSAPSASPEVRTRSRIRSNSCEDISNSNEGDFKTSDNVLQEDLANDTFHETESKKNDLHPSIEDQNEPLNILSNASEKSIKNTEQNLASPQKPLLQQWPNSQYQGMQGQSWNNMQNQWNNAQFLANLAMAQGQGNLPLFMGYRQQFQQFYPGCFSNATNDAACQMEPTNKKAKTDNIIGSSQNAFPQNALQMFASMAAQRAPLPTDLLMQQRGMPFFTAGGQSASKPTNPAAIAIAAAKDGSVFCMPNDARLFGAHPGAAQWQDVIKDDVMMFQQHYPQNNSTVNAEEFDDKKSLKFEIGKLREESENSDIDRKDGIVLLQGDNNGNKNSELTVSIDTNSSSSFKASPVSPRRKPKPHPGPIIIPASVNNKVTHSVTFTGRTTRPLSPVKREFHNAPIYTPPPMLSPRSIFFTGGTCGTPRSAIPLTPGRLLLSARKLSTADGGKDEEATTILAIPEPKINVGFQFQAEVNATIEPREKSQNDEHRATLMWAPLKEDKNKIKEVESFLEMACSSVLFGGSSNKEYASHILHRTRGSVKEAVRLLLSRRHILRADDQNADYHYTGSSRWSAKERLAFREAYRTKGKVFNLIQKEVETKSVQQCVEFYYLWKATNPEGFRARTRYVEVESEQDEEEITTPSAFETPLSSARDAVFQCDYPECQARFVSRQALNGHIRVHGGSFGKPIEVRRPRPKPPVIITPSLPRENAITSQKRKKSPSPAPPNNAGTPPDGAPLQFACKVCGRVFSKVKSRSAHMKTHVPKKPDEHKNVNPPTLAAHA